MSAAAAYGRLKDRFARLATIGECASMLSWDAAAMMPAGGGAARGDQFAVLAGLAHAQLIASEVGDDLSQAEAAGAPADPWEAANLRLMRHAYTRATALPADLVEAQARANSACEKVWRDARRNADFAQVRSHLSEVVRLVRESASAWACVLGLSPYDALMDGFQQGIGSADVAPIFADYETFLRKALPEVEERQARSGAAIRPQGPFPIETQEALCRALSARLGLDFDHARLDRS
ncbi:MAG: carboxypeptidase M32, partial [Acetobacteraceae bacterium]